MEPIRKTVRVKKPNPLFETWLEEWINDARKMGSEMQHKFEKALESLRKYPILLNSGKECLILENFDSALCIKLDRKLADHKRSVTGSQTTQIKMSETASFQSTESISEEKTDHSKISPAGKKVVKGVKKRKANQNEPTLMEEGTSSQLNPDSRGKSYEPKYRSGGFALLVTLLNNESLPESKGTMGKGELQKEAQQFCDSSFTKPANGSFYTAWSSMSQLLSKKLVQKVNKTKFSLTVSGRELAIKLVTLYQCEEIVPSRTAAVSALTSSDVLAPSKRTKKIKEPSQDDCPDEIEDFKSVPDYFLPNTFDIVLLVDTAETIGVQKQSQDETIRELTKRGVKFEVRRLKVGDFLWIARDKETGAELVLPFIVERKRMDDLSRSIKDGRFHEQKFRLKQCGLPNLIYLLESQGGKEYHGLPLSSLYQALTNTEIVDKFSIKITSGHSDSMMYLSFLTKIFIDIFQSKTLFTCKKENLSDEYNLEDYVVSLCTYNSFCRNVGKARHFSVKEMFLKQLIQLHGLSFDKAWSIVESYPSPVSLMSALNDAGDSLLTNLTFGEMNRKVGPIVSKTLHSFYTQEKFMP